MAENDNAGVVGWTIYERWIEWDDASYGAYVISYNDMDDAVRNAKRMQTAKLPDYILKRWFVITEKHYFHQYPTPEIIDSLAKVVIDKKEKNNGGK